MQTIDIEEGEYINFEIMYFRCTVCSNQVEVFVYVSNEKKKNVVIESAFVDTDTDGKKVVFLYLF